MTTWVAVCVAVAIAALGAITGWFVLGRLLVSPDPSRVMFPGHNALAGEPPGAPP
jgi:hypothetical protein